MSVVVAQRPAAAAVPMRACLCRIGSEPLECLRAAGAGTDGRRGSHLQETHFPTPSTDADATRTRARRVEQR
jgi:hypothetical protein